jgi:ADP-ribose pyrophosphatase YjhB (NUDIX family)
MHLLATIDPQSVGPGLLEGWHERRAARAVVFDARKQVALLFVSKLGYYKLPGGGIEEGEGVSGALKRECMEEIGCVVEIVQEIGMTIEYRSKFQVRQESYCYLASVVGEKGEPTFEKDELEDGFQVKWLSLDEAIQLVEKSNTEEYQSGFIVPRELILLREAKRIVEK